MISLIWMGLTHQWKGQNSGFPGKKEILSVDYNFSSCQFLAYNLTFWTCLTSFQNHINYNHLNSRLSWCSQLCCRKGKEKDVVKANLHVRLPKKEPLISWSCRLGSCLRISNYKLLNYSTKLNSQPCRTSLAKVRALIGKNRILKTKIHLGNPNEAEHFRPLNSTDSFSNRSRPLVCVRLTPALIDEPVIILLRHLPQDTANSPQDLSLPLFASRFTIRLMLMGLKGEVHSVILRK